MNAETPVPRPIRKRARPTAGGETQSESDGTAAERPVSADGRAVVSALNEAAQAMAQSLAQITSSLQERRAECTQKYVSALRSAVPEGAAQDLQSAYQEVLDAITSQDAGKMAEAQAAYLDLLGKVTAAVAEAANAATTDCVSDFEDVLAESHEHGQQQYFQYLDTLKSVLAKASDNDLSPGILALVAHNMGSAAALSQGLFRQSD